MSDYMSHLGDLFTAAAGAVSGMRGGRNTAPRNQKTYDKERQKPVLRCSICNGEQVAGFRDIHTGRFEEAALIRNERELEDFMRLYGIDEISKEY